jgi:hypothetical protein
LISYDASDKDNIELVRDIVVIEMKKPHSTILAVVAANIDPKIQGVLSLCAEHDTKGKRIGIITRPDTAEKVLAETYVEIAEGRREEEVKITLRLTCAAQSQRRRSERGAHLSKNETQPRKNFFAQNRGRALVQIIWVS